MDVSFEAHRKLYILVSKTSMKVKKITDFVYIWCDTNGISESENDQTRSRYINYKADVRTPCSYGAKKQQYPKQGQ